LHYPKSISSFKVTPAAIGYRGVFLIKIGFLIYVIEIRSCNKTLVEAISKTLEASQAELVEA